MQDQTRRNSTGRIIATTCLLSLGYAVIRYHLVGDVPWKDFPFFILNKGLSLAAFFLITLNFTLGPLKNMGINVPSSWLLARKALGMSGFLLVLIHVLISFMLFKPAIFSKFFEADGFLTLNAGLSMLGGILAFVVLWAYNLSFQTQLREDKAFIGFITSRNFLLVAGLFIAMHIFFMGYAGWSNPAGWPGDLPPISLVVFVTFLISYGINLLARN